MGSWRLSTQYVRRVSDDEVCDLKKPLDSDVARSSITREHWIQLCKSRRYKALELLLVEDDDAVRRDLGSDLLVRSSREVVLSRAFGRRQPFFEHVTHSFKCRVQSSGVKQRRALELRGGKDLRVKKR